MRKSYHTLCGLVTNELGCDPCSGDVYIFINKARNRIKLLHWEPGGLVLYCKLLESGTFGMPSGLAKDAVSGRIEWSELVMIVEGIIGIAGNTAVAANGYHDHPRHNPSRRPFARSL